MYFRTDHERTLKSCKSKSVTIFHPADGPHSENWVPVDHAISNTEKRVLSSALLVGVLTGTASTACNLAKAGQFTNAHSISRNLPTSDVLCVNVKWSIVCYKEYCATVKWKRSRGAPPETTAQPSPQFVHRLRDLPAIRDRLLQLLPGDHSDVFASGHHTQPPAH